MNVYMFDGVVYNGNSVIDFMFILFKKNKGIIKYVFLWAWSFFLYMIGCYEKSQFIEKFWKCLDLFDDKQSIKEEFWNKNTEKINKWYLDRKDEHDYVISYLPEFVTEGTIDDITFINGLSEDDIIKKINVNENNFCFFASCKEADKITEVAFESYVVKEEIFVKRDDYKASFIETFFSRSFISFVFIGVVNTLNTIIFSAVSSLVFDPNLSFVLGYIFSLSVNYILNSKITFRETISFTKYIKFCISYIPNFIIQNVIVIIFYNGLGWNKVLVYALAGLLGIPVTFVLLKIFAFKEKKE